MQPINSDCYTLLLMPCSDTKLPHAAQPRELYLGPMWQTLRTHRGNLPWRNVFVLSGKYGFLYAEEFIQTYNERLTREKADYLIAGGIQHPNDHIGSIPLAGSGTRPVDMLRPWQFRDRQPFSTVLVAGAGEYARVFRAYVSEAQRAGIISADADVHYVRGGIGEQRQQLGEWLREFNSVPSTKTLQAAA
jgi:hypothetical protein